VDLGVPRGAAPDLALQTSFPSFWKVPPRLEDC
jgi:hypothetical protein